jgi:hypothetical protein
MFPKINFPLIKGECSGDYSCYEGLVCNDYTAKCMCPDNKPTWNSKLKTCSYKFMGCYNYNNYTNVTYDFSLSEIYLASSSSSTTVDIDDCIDVCKVLNKRYTHMIFYSSPRCGCSNSYNNFSDRADDLNCNMPCSFYNYIGTNLCPKAFFYSSFQIGM